MFTAAKAAADLGESVSKVGVTFGPAAADVIGPVSDEALRLGVTATFDAPQSEAEIWASFYLTMSRGGSHEQVRHAHDVAISQRSTRFCDEDGSSWVPHPLLKGMELTVLGDAQSAANAAYRLLMGSCKERLSDNTEVGKLQAVKQSRGAARAVLGTALETQMVFSCSLMQWKWQLSQRMAEAADAEIRVLYNRVFEELKLRWPHNFAGWETRPASDGCGLVLCAFGDDAARYGWKVI